MVSADVASNDIDVRAYLAMLWRRRFLIALVVLPMVAAAVLLSVRQTPLYEAKAQLLVDPSALRSLSQSDASSRLDPDLVVSTEIQVLKSRPVKEAVEESLGAVRDVGASRVGETLIVEVRGQSSDPDRAAKIADAYATAYTDLRRTEANAELFTLTDEIQRKIQQLQTEMDRLDPRVDGARRDGLIAQQSRFRERLNLLDVEAAARSSAAHIVAPALVPTSPVKPRPIRNVAVALFFGLLLGVSLALLLEFLNDSIRSKDDVELIPGASPVIGIIPHVRSRRGDGHLVSLDRFDEPTGEAFRALRTSVQLLAGGDGARTIEVTSAMPQEGKTTVTTNLAVVLASAGRRVVLVDCDFRRPMVHRVFGLSPAVGVTSVLADEVPLEEALQAVADVPGLRVLAAGPMPPDPADLAGSQRLSHLLFELQSQADFILLDSPPVLPVTDATLLALWVDATITVVRAGSTRRNQLREALDLLRQARAPVMGTVLNGAAVGDSYAAGYYYQARVDRHDRRAGEQTNGARPARLWRKPKTRSKGNDNGAGGARVRSGSDGNRD